jgi:hypothetical protein
MRIASTTKHGGSVIIPLTGIAEEGVEYVITTKGNVITLTPAKDVIIEGKSEGHG